jgi:phytoene dehydrogenase-like protein
MQTTAESAGSTRRRVLIVGGGLAGLACAREVLARGHEPTVFEASSEIGGRVASDVLDGFTVDRGFQVLLTHYPEVWHLVREDDLALRRFASGARIWTGRRFVSVGHPWRHPFMALGAVLGGAFGVGDVRGAIRLISALQEGRAESAGAEGRTTHEWLRSLGLSPTLIELFFRPFLGGVFLDRSLETDAGRAKFYLRMFAEGAAAVPASGMRRLADAIAAPLPASSVRLQHRVVSADARSVTLADGTRESGDAVVVAGDMTSTRALFPELPSTPWQATVSVWFATPLPSAADAALLLAPRGRAVHHACWMSSVAPSYAPPGRGLFCANHVGSAGDVRRGVAHAHEVAGAMRRELDEWFGAGSTSSWETLCVQRIDRALPRQHPGDVRAAWPAEIDGVHLAGDRCADASINGALRSGRLAAERALSL